MTATHDTGRPRRSLIPWIFVGAMGLVVAVNAVMVTVAVRSWTGLSVSKPYERGIAYNQVLAAQHRQDALGWRLLGTAETGPGQVRRITLTAEAADGGPLVGLELDARLVRPIEVLPDQPVAFRAAGPGLYRAETTLPKPGQWELRVDARLGADHFHLRERLIFE